MHCGSHIPNKSLVLSCFLVCSLQPCGHSCWERAGLLALLYVMFYCVFVTFRCGVLGQVWYLIVSIPDLYLLTYFSQSRTRAARLKKRPP